MLHPEHARYRFGHVNTFRCFVFPAQQRRSMPIRRAWVISMLDIGTACNLPIRLKEPGMIRIYLAVMMISPLTRASGGGFSHRDPLS